MSIREQQEEMLKKESQDIQNNSDLKITESQIEYWTTDDLPKKELRTRNITIEFIKKHPYNLTNSIIAFLFALCGIIFVFFVLWIFSMDRTVLNDKKVIPIVFMMLYGFQILCLPTLLSLKKKFQSLFFKSAINKGISIPGQIVCYCKSDHYRTRTDTWYYSYNLVIKYKDNETNEDKLFMTPNLTFVPCYAFGSLNCNVYKFKNKVFAYDFETVSDCNQMVKIPENNEYYKDAKVTGSKSNMTLFLVMAFIFLIIDFSIVNYNLHLF